MFLEAFSWITEPTAWAGLFALVTLEVVLGVDNLVFIAILSERVIPNLRDKARVTGLIMALGLRIVFLTVMAKLVNKLQAPLFSIGGLAFSGRGLIFIAGGAFLLFKATSELHERLEGVPHAREANRHYSGFWTVVVEIMALDAVFSLDAVITAVGMVDHLGIMVTAVSIAIGLMLLASKPLTRFVNAHPTVVMLCLSFLLMIGLSLIIEGFGFHVPKGYLYVAIGFSVLIEVFNQVAGANYRKSQAKRSLRERTAETILRLMGEKERLLAHEEDSEPSKPKSVAGVDAEAIVGAESSMISGVLSLGDRSLRSLMTPRVEISWVDVEDSPEYVRKQILSEQHSHYPISRGSLDNLLGVARSANILEALRSGVSLDQCKILPATMAPESMDAIRLLDLMRSAAGHLVLAVDEFGSITGVLTPVDVFEIIAGEFFEHDEKPDITELEDGALLVDGSTDLHHLGLRLNIEGLLDPESDYGSVAGLLLDKLGRLPKNGEELSYKGLKFTVYEVSDRRIKEVLVRKEDEEEFEEGD